MTCPASSELSFLGGPRREFGLAKMINPNFLDPIFDAWLVFSTLIRSEKEFNVRG